MGVVIALISVLVVLLSGLSSGLVNDGVSGLKTMPATAFAFDEGTMTDNAFSRSVVDEDQLAVWADADGIADAEPMGVNIVNGVTDGDEQIDLTLFGVDPGGFLSPSVSSGERLGAPDGIIVSEPLRDEGVEIGTVITLDRLDVELTVIGFTEGQATFGHVDIAYLPIGTWQLLASGEAAAGAPTAEQVEAADFSYSSVVALRADDGAEPDYAAIDSKGGTTTMSLTESFNASPGYEAETLTLSMIQVFLYAICALVVGAFFTAWTTVRVHGTDVAGLSNRATTRFRLRNIGFVFQSGNLLPALTAGDQLRLAGRLAGNRRVDPAALLASVGMDHRAKHRPGELSGGERQRVGIARALVNDPSLLLVDEPTAALDRRRSHEVVELLAQRAHQSGVAVVMVTHDRDMLGHCDRTLEMVDGRLDAVALSPA
ncbi:ABC transporter ATP-binding protein [Microbacterium sp. MAHUQ-60]|uniref:ABC transporter ATP-binding protein n=1 Tax=unclassified Microbacterium TaxID=2609290 RepID=UPI00361FD121